MHYYALSAILNHHQGGCLFEGCANRIRLSSSGQFASRESDFLTTAHLDRDKLKTYDRRTRKCSFFRVGAASIRLIQFALASPSRTKPLPSCLQLFSLTASSALISVWIRRWYTRRISCEHSPTASLRATRFGPALPGFAPGHFPR